jgi:hypothetical protein
MFFHKATGRYGLVNLTLSGDMDLNPVGGEYRFSSKIPGVEINQLMLTLKARPPPYPVAGVLKGDFYCQGALDAPVFSGHVRASAADVSRAVDSVDPPTFASAALRDAPGAVGAYDHVPFESVVGSFDFDTDTCVSHSLSEILFEGSPRGYCHCPPFSTASRVLRPASICKISSLVLTRCALHIQHRVFGRFRAIFGSDQSV